MELRLIIAGGRDFSDYDKLECFCSHTIKCMENEQKQPFESIEIISGRAQGADRQGEVFAFNKGYTLKMFPADWDTNGKFAGYMRNEQMAKYAACVDEPPTKRDQVRAVLCAFWDGRSRGTKNMISFAHMYEFDNITICHYPVREEVDTNESQSKSEGDG